MNSDSSEILQRFLFVVGLAVTFFIIFTYLLSMCLGILVFFSSAEGLNFSRALIILNPLLVIDVKVTVNAGLYFLFLWWIFALCFAASWKYKESLHKKVKDLFSDDARRNPLNNNLLAMPLITSMLLVAIIILHLVQTQSGLPTGEPPSIGPFLGFLISSQAPIIEEVIFRIIPLGTFLATYIFVVGKKTRPELYWIERLKTCILSVLLPEKAKKTVGLKTIEEGGLFGGGVTWAEWMMVVFTAFLFGIAHYSGGWEAGKISQAGLSGVVFALAYLYYGIQAPLLLHWYFNYYFAVFNLSSSYYSAEIGFAYFAVLSANVFLGALMWLAVIVFGMLSILRMLRKRSETAIVSEPP